jgi:hypothetical protein
MVRFVGNFENPQKHLSRILFLSFKNNKKTLFPFKNQFDQKNPQTNETGTSITSAPKWNENDTPVEGKKEVDAPL